MWKKVIYVIVFVAILGLGEVQAQVWERAAYWDGSYPSAWAGAGGATRDALAAVGYTILNADELKTWMDARIADRKLSVVVFCRDVVPETVCETMSATCTLRKYLDAGGKIVWYSDIPMYYVGHPDGNMTTWGDAGAPAILGFNTSSAPRDTWDTVTITSAGADWGLTQTWGSQRPAAAGITTNLTVLATDSAGNYPAWVKHYVAGDKGRGFVRFRDTGGQALVDDIIRVAEYLGLKASNPDPPDGATGVTGPLLQWEPGTWAKSHDVYLATDEVAVTNATSSDPMGQAEVYKVRYGHAMWWELAPWIPGATYYWRIDEVEADGTTIHTGNVWSFKAAPLEAYDPDPRDGAKWVGFNPTLYWTPGADAVRYDVYFGTDETEVANGTGGTFKGNQSGASYAPETLLEGTTYYWRIDGEDFTGTQKYPGHVWRFTTLGPDVGLRGYYYHWVDDSVGGGGNPGPVDPFQTLVMTRVDREIDFSWVDGSPEPGVVNEDNFSVRWVGEIETALTETHRFYTSTDDGARLWVNDQLIIDQWVEQGTTEVSGTIDLVAGVGYPIVFEYYENGGGAVAELRWSSPSIPYQIIPAGPLHLPLKAATPDPPNGATGVEDTPTLSWKAGEQAAQHQVFFGTDEDAVAAADTTTVGIYRGTQSVENTSYLPSEVPLEWERTYYWKVNEANGVDLWEGSVWSFTVADHFIVDNFEDYNDYCDRIFYTWGDGWGHNGDPACGVPPSNGNGTGSTVGYLQEPYAEQTITHDGSFQSMPFEYLNDGSTGKALYSETERTFDPPQDWTYNGIEALALWFYGDPGNAAEKLYVVVEDSAGRTKVVNHTADTNAVLSDTWQEWNIELTQVSDAGVNLQSVKKMYIGVGDRVAPTFGGGGMLYIDDIGLYRPRCVPLLSRPDADIAFPYDCVVDYKDLAALADEWLAEKTEVREWDRVAYYDGTYPTGWSETAVAEGVRDYLSSAGYTVVNASQLKTWMDARIADKALSVVVFCQDIAPETVVETQDANCTVRKYLDAGGKIVFYADIPFYYQGHADGTSTTWGVDGSINILGFNAAGAGWDSGDTVAINTAGANWGLTQTSISVRPAAAGDVDIVLATDSDGDAAAWVKHYWPGDRYRGFVRIADFNVGPGDIAMLPDLLRVTEYKGALVADLYEDDAINFRDYSIMAGGWLEEVVWP